MSCAHVDDDGLSWWGGAVKIMLSCHHTPRGYVLLGVVEHPEVAVYLGTSLHWEENHARPGGWTDCRHWYGDDPDDMRMVYAAMRQCLIAGDSEARWQDFAADEDVGKRSPRGMAATLGIVSATFKALLGDEQRST
jgi:hypothetical protein